jgi:hypothetical protein
MEDDGKYTAGRREAESWKTEKMKVGWDRGDFREVTQSADIKVDRRLCDKEGERHFWPTI